jgi:hypothetical protein
MGLIERITISIKSAAMCVTRHKWSFLQRLCHHYEGLLINTLCALEFTYEVCCLEFPTSVFVPAYAKTPGFKHCALWSSTFHDVTLTVEGQEDRVLQRQ